MISFMVGVIEETKSPTDKADRQKNLEYSIIFFTILNRDSKIAHPFSLVLTPSFPEAIASILRLFVLLS